MAPVSSGSKQTLMLYHHSADDQGFSACSDTHGLLRQHIVVFGTTYEGLWRPCNHNTSKCLVWFEDNSSSRISRLLYCRCWQKKPSITTCVLHSMNCTHLFQVPKHLAWGVLMQSVLIQYSSLPQIKDIRATLPQRDLTRLAAIELDCSGHVTLLTERSPLHRRISHLTLISQSGALHSSPRGLQDAPMRMPIPPCLIRLSNRLTWLFVVDSHFVSLHSSGRDFMMFAGMIWFGGISFSLHYLPRKGETIFAWFNVIRTGVEQSCMKSLIWLCWELDLDAHRHYPCPEIWESTWWVL